MSVMDLKGRHVLVVEDEYMLADALAGGLADAGAIVLGPVGSLPKTLSLIENAAAIDAAVLDVNLSGELVYPAADILTARNVPFVFTTGYDSAAIPQRFEAITRCEKSDSPDQVVAALVRSMEARGQA